MEGLFYAFWRGNRLTKDSPKTFQKGVKDKRQVVIFCGDSLTHGHLGYDWVGAIYNLMRRVAMFYKT